MQLVYHDHSSLVVDSHLNSHCYTTNQPIFLHFHQHLLLKFEIIWGDFEFDVFFGISMVDDQVHLYPLIVVLVVYELSTIAFLDVLLKIGHLHPNILGFHFDFIGELLLVDFANLKHLVGLYLLDVDFKGQKG